MSSVIISKDNEELCLHELKLSIKENRKLDNFAEFFDDRFLLHFVRGKKFNSKKAYIALDNFITARSEKYKEMFKNLRPSTCRGLEIKSGRILKNRDHLSRLIGIARVKCWDPRQISIEEFMNMGMLCIDEMLNYVEAEENGIVVILDMSGYNLHHMMAIRLHIVVNYINLIWNNFPLRPQAVHIVNEMYMFTLLMTALKPFLPKLIRKRLNMHSSDLNSLHKHISPSILPDFLGGTLKGEDAFDLTFEQRIRDKENYYTQFASKLN